MMRRFFLNLEGLLRAHHPPYVRAADKNVIRLKDSFPCFPRFNTFQQRETRQKLTNHSFFGSFASNTWYERQ
jgi:hypothetical protein